MRYFIVNTDKKHVPGAEEDMIKNKKASAYGNRKMKIDKLRKNDRIFLFSNENGIIVRGIAKGKVEEKNFFDSNNEFYIEHNMKLENFEDIRHLPLTPEEVIKITGVNYRYMATLFKLRSEKAGEKIWDAFSGRTR